MRKIAAVFLLSMIALAARPVTGAAQFYEFGQNKIQYRQFEWRVLRGPHIDLYYYPAETQLAEASLAWAEASYDTLALRFGHEVAARIPLIVYASHVDFEQTNVLPFIPPEGLLGATDFLKRRVTMPFRGNFAEFRHTMRHELVHVFQLDMIATSYHSAPRARQISLPLWWTEGLAEFWSGGEDARDEMILRDMTLNGRLPTLDQLENYYGFLVYPVGGRIHRWLAETYGAWRVAEVYRELNRHDSFERAMQSIYGRTVKQLTDEFTYAMRQQYFPAAATQAPPSLLGREVARLAIKPTLRAGSQQGDSAGEVLYVSPANGYLTIYRTLLDGRRGAREVVSAGRSEGLESLHPFDSRMDASRPGLLLFSGRYRDRDALVVWDLRRNRLAGRYQFPELVSILSPMWIPGEEAIVFSGLAESGISDLYSVRLPSGELTQLTDDVYQDLDPAPSPDGHAVVFTSDRTADGLAGGINLMWLDRMTGRIRPLSSGLWIDETPAWGPDGRIYFTSSRSGNLNIWSVDTLGAARRETSTWSAAFDATPLASGGLLAGSFQNGSYNLYQLAPDSAAHRDTVAAPSPSLGVGTWTWLDDSTSIVQDSVSDPYQRKLTLDFAAGGVSITPGYGGVQGGTFLLTDLLGDHALIGSIGSFQDRNTPGNFLANLSGNIVFINRTHRINWGVGAYRFVGRVFEGDVFASYEERTTGAVGLLQYPLSRFNRVESSVSLAHSDRFDFDLPDVDHPRRVGWIASNYVSFIRDNSLWLASGPIDGFRLALTVGTGSDFSNSRFDNYLFAGDIRRYFRLGRRSALASRTFGFWSGGDRPSRINIGGTVGLRGYPNFGNLLGSKAWLLTNEVRFPLLNRLVLGTPIGELIFPEFQGAIFGDLGRAWVQDNSPRGVLGSAGGSVRLALAPLAVVRFDAGVRFGGNNREGYGLTDKERDGGFFSFFFGYNF